MSNVLLEASRDLTYIEEHLPFYDGMGFDSGIDESDFKNIEKELKAFDIINRKGVNVGYLKDAWQHNEEVNYDKDLVINEDTIKVLACAKQKSSTSLTQEEYDLLKEVLL